MSCIAKCDSFLQFSNKKPKFIRLQFQTVTNLKINYVIFKKLTFADEGKEKLLGQKPKYDITQFNPRNQQFRLVCILLYVLKCFYLNME